MASRPGGLTLWGVRRTGLGAATALAWACAMAQPAGSGAPGVNPKDNLTKGEAFVKFDRLDGGGSLQAVAVKYDRAFDATTGGNIELPLIRLNAPGPAVSGLGDVALRVRRVGTSGPWSVIVAAEAVLPTASRDEFGRGKWQLNPVAGVVYALTPTSFAFIGYKHFFSIAGDDHRPDISDMQPRALLARVWEQGYWALADLKYTKALKGDRSESLDLEFEGGAMLASDLGAWVRRHVGHGQFASLGPAGRAAPDLVIGNKGGCSCEGSRVPV